MTKRGRPKIFLSFILHALLHSFSHADSFLSDNLVKRDQVQNVLEHQPVKAPACQHIPTGPIETTTCDYESVESVNEELYSNLHQLVQTPFFKYFQVDLYRECPFWQENGVCMNRECGITTVDESQIPEKWRAASLSKIELPSTYQSQLPGCYYRDSDFCFLDDMSEGEYFDLTLVPERYTGYAGPPAHRVWRAIYEENCFGVSELNSMSGSKSVAADTLGKLSRGYGTESDDQCLEKRVYHKIISGLHASISTHICYEYLNQSSGEWSPNLECFVTRVASHPERLQYIYFNVVLLMRAVARIGPYLSAYDYCSSLTDQDDMDTIQKLSKVITIAQNVGKFDETLLFRDQNANTLKEEFKTHFRNVTRIMDCVGCDKCRLWGKVQTTGLATALKILFELDEQALRPTANSHLLRRSEVVALINTLHRFSESLEFVNGFRQMWSDASPSESAKLIEDSEEATRPQPRPSPHAGEAYENTTAEGLAFWVRKCRESTHVCVRALIRIWTRLSRALFTAPETESRPAYYEEL